MSVISSGQAGPSSLTAAIDRLRHSLMVFWKARTGHHDWEPVKSLPNLRWHAPHPSPPKTPPIHFHAGSHRAVGRGQTNPFKGMMKARNDRQE